MIYILGPGYVRIARIQNTGELIKMSADKDYKTCTELKNLTPQILKEWYRKTNRLEIKLVRHQIFLRCPLTDVLVSEKFCQRCPHNYGEASVREIYCVFNIERLKSVRTQRKTKDLR